MKDLEEIFKPGRNVASIISDLMEKSMNIKDWATLKKNYFPELHDIITDKTVLKDKVRSDGSIEKSARLAVGLEQLLTKRVNEFTFAIPVKRKYDNINNDVRQAIADAIEAIYRYSHIDSENLKRGLAYYACCEICTVWYAVNKPNNLYGFESEYKLKCKTYSPMGDVTLYPLIDDLGEMHAQSFYWVNKASDGKETELFETYISNRHYKWKRDKDGQWEDVLTSLDSEGNIVSGEEIERLGKIPAIYACRQNPIYDGLSPLREDIEYTMSRESNTLSYNSAPVLKVAGQVKGEEIKGESKRVYRVENGGDVSYVSWNQQIEALKYHIDMLTKLFFMQGQMPDISFDAMRSLGNIGYDARKTLLMDAHLKIGDESGAWYEFFERENNVVKAFLKLMKPEWADEIDNIDIKNIITPFIQDDEKYEIEKRTAANGNKPIESQLESIQRYGKSKNAEETLAQINKEDAEANQSKMSNLMESAI